MSLRVRWAFAAVVGVLALAACGDSFFEPAAEPTSPVRLSYGLAPEYANLATPQEDFDNANQAEVFIEGGGRELFNGVVPISRASGSQNKVAEVRVSVGEEPVQATVRVTLLVNGDPVLEGSTALTISSRGSSGDGIFGTYELTSVGGFSVPGTIPDGAGPGCDLRVASGSLTLDSDGTFSFRFLLEEIDRTGETPDCGGSFEETETGVFERSGDTIHLTDSSGETVSGSVSDGVLTLTDPEEGDIFRFEKSGGSSGPITAEIFLEPVTGGGGTAAINGTVVDAFNEGPVANAQVELLSGRDATSGSPVASATTSSSGTFSLTGLAGGNYTLVVTAAGFIQARQNVSLANGETFTRTVALSEQLGEGQTRIVLTWGASPSDLDSHITGPDGQGGGFHVYHGNLGSDTSTPFTTLDDDDVDGFGPETITIWQQFSGTYCYSVHNFSGSPALSTSAATVEVFQEGSRVATFDVPGGTGDVWTVFSLNGGNLTPVNRIATGGPPGVCQ